jgi:hypothetical protein
VAIDIFMAALLDTACAALPTRRRREPRSKQASDSMPCTHFYGESERRLEKATATPRPPARRRLVRTTIAMRRARRVLAARRGKR